MLSILLSCNLGKKIKCLLCQPFHNCDIEYFLRPKLSIHFDFSILILKECTNFKLINGWEHKLFSIAKFDTLIILCPNNEFEHLV